MEKMFKFVLLICLGFLPTPMHSTGSLEMSILGFEKECNSDAICKITGYVFGTFEDKAERPESACTHVTLFQCESSADCSQSSSWQEKCQLFAYPCQMSTCGNGSRTEPKCYCSTGHHIKIWFPAVPTLNFRLTAKIMDNGQEIGQVVSNVFEAHDPDDPEHSQRQKLDGSNQLRFDLELVVASVLVASYLTKRICT
ncbi:uncharacterized protein LOC131941823 [Physella acuta]|uniref:uncharacterized protein LOC131941823 n=1 Tax=Physella acuta TaxID=109671 RepID=UPI0027DAD835|nr:uncharacterized protein LOC131941823 [Physella acuta]